MDIDPATELGEYAEHPGIPRKSYAGYKYPEDVNRWFSTAIGKEVFAVRSTV